MLTAKENLKEVMTGGNPERFVKQYEPFKVFTNAPHYLMYPFPKSGMGRVQNGWGVTLEWPEGTPGFFPVHDKEHIVVKDIENWTDYVKAPPATFPEEMYDTILGEVEKVNRNEQLVTLHFHPGIFEQCHYLCEISNTLTYFYTDPESMHDLIKYILDWEMEMAVDYCKHIHPDAILHHDDWGTQKSTFMSPAMFEDFFLDAYKELYGYYKSQGVMIVHHADCYCATLVPDMIEMGIDIWQGAMTVNNIPELIEQYGGQITFMGGIDNGLVDREDWNDENIYNVAKAACTSCGMKYFIPCSTVGNAKSTYPGVYEAIDKAIDKINGEYTSKEVSTTSASLIGEA